MAQRDTTRKTGISPLWIVVIVVGAMLAAGGLVVGVAVLIMMLTLQPAQPGAAGGPGAGSTHGTVDSSETIEPSTYYDAIDAEADAQTLRSQLHALIASHTERNYRELWDALAYTDADPERAGHVVLFYTGWSRSADAHGGGPSNWNREHVWAKSRGGFGNMPPAGTDLHHIRPTDVTVNAARANFAFDNGGDLYTDGDGPTTCRVDADSWEPRDGVKGDVARIIFYMAIRYEDAALDMELTELAPPQGDGRPVHGVLSTLLAWHAADPPDDFEGRRNDRVYELQGNRNPFIDHPAWVGVIWGG